LYEIAQQFILFLFSLLIYFFLIKFYPTDSKAGRKNLMTSFLLYYHKKLFRKVISQGLFRIMIAGKELPLPLRPIKFNAYKITEYDTISFYMINATMNELVDSILPLPIVLFADDGKRIPKEEVQQNTLDLSTNKINVVHRKFHNGTETV
jgi:hypothetical protein